MANQQVRSKINTPDAEEWLSSLQQVGEGWYRQVGLAIKAGAPKALGMTRKEFAGQIGQKLVDPREAIIQLHNEGHSERAIADILGVADYTIGIVLAEEGLREWTPRLIGRAGRSAGEDGTTVEGTAVEDGTDEVKALKDDLDAVGKKLTAKTNAEKKAKEQLAEVKGKLVQMVEDELAKRREEKAKEQTTKSPQEQEREAKESEAYAEEIAGPVRRMAASIATKGIVGLLHESQEMLTEAAEYMTSDDISDVQGALNGLSHELEVARGMLELNGQEIQ